MAVIEKWIRQDLQDTVVPRRLDYYLFEGDEDATRIGVEVLRYGDPVNIEEDGESLGYFVTPDGETHELEVDVVGNRASVLLTAECCAAPGAVNLAIKVGGTTMLRCAGYVYKTTTSEIIQADQAEGEENGNEG